MNEMANNSFDSLLQQWERCFATPIISGELTTWCENLRETTEELRARLRQRMDDTHQREFEDIARQDPELLPRVEELKKADQELWEAFENMHKKITALYDQAMEEQRDTDKLRHAADTVAVRGLEMVVQIRKQETSVATWLVEAYQRDRGDVD